VAVACPPASDRLIMGWGVIAMRKALALSLGLVCLLGLTVGAQEVATCSGGGAQCWEIVLNGLAALSSLAMAVLSCFLFKINRALMNLQDQRENPRPVVVNTTVYIRLPSRLAVPHAALPVLHVGLDLFNPGDSPIYLKAFTIDEWELQDFLVDRSQFIRDPEGNVVIIPPRDNRRLGIDFLLRNPDKAIERMGAGEGKKARIVLEFAGGTKTGKLPIDVKVAVMA